MASEIPRRPRVAGRRLRFDLDQALEHASREIGQTLQWSEHELQVIERAATAADRSEVLGRLWKKELAGEARRTVLIKLAAEQRAQDKAVVDLIARVNPGVGPARSERHARAGSRCRDGPSRATEGRPPVGFTSAYAGTSRTTHSNGRRTSGARTPMARRIRVSGSWTGSGQSRRSTFRRTRCQATCGKGLRRGRGRSVCMGRALERRGGSFRCGRSLARTTRSRSTTTTGPGSGSKKRHLRVKFDRGRAMDSLRNRNPDQSTPLASVSDGGHYREQDAG